MPPVQIGGHEATSHLVPALLPPHRKTTSNRLAAVAALCFGCVTQLPGSVHLRQLFAQETHKRLHGGTAEIESATSGGEQCGQRTRQAHDCFDQPTSGTARFTS
jgi:hypothetical protein